MSHSLQGHAHRSSGRAAPEHGVGAPAAICYRAGLYWFIIAEVSEKLRMGRHGASRLLFVRY